MPFRKNAKGQNQYYYKPHKSAAKIIQKDWFKEHEYKQNIFSPEFFENIEKTLTPARLGYWAYAIDGDGWIYWDGVSKKGLEVGIRLTDREPIQELADIYGTSISRKDFLNKKHKSSYGTKMTGKRAPHFLRLICPYMTEKRKKATQVINMFDPNYHPPKISINFRKNPDLLEPHMGMIAGFFDTEGSVGISIRKQKRMTKKFGKRVYASLNPWVEFTNTDTRPLRKIKKILETWPFKFKSSLRVKRKGYFKKNGEECNPEYVLVISKRQHLLFMKMFAPWILISRKRDYADKFELKKRIYKICNEKK